MSSETQRPIYSEAFFEFLSDSEGLTIDDLRTELNAIGVDTDDLIKRISQIVKESSTERRLAWLTKAKNKRAEIERKIHSMIVSGNVKDVDLKNRIKDILEGRRGHAAFQHAEAYFRKAENLNERDLESLMNDLEQLNLLEEVEEEQE